MKFTTGFNKYACIHDVIRCEDLSGSIHAVAEIHHDADAKAPDEQNEGFWPSLCSGRAGYMGPDASYQDYLDAKEKAADDMKAWRNDEWWYAGVAVRIWVGNTPLTDEFAHVMWGNECNRPGTDNSHLLEVANELLPAALEDARNRIKALQSISL